MEHHNYHFSFTTFRYTINHPRVCLKLNHGCFICLNLIIIARWNIQQYPYHADWQLLLPINHPRVCFKAIMDVLYVYD
jgi:hypothetical protein